MGKKIPGKKHRGVKDPLVQLARRNESIKHKINAPPKHPDEQEIPKSVLELNKLRQMVKDGNFKKKKRKRQRNKKLIDISSLSNPGPNLPGMVQKDKSLPSIMQTAGESERSFLNRINAATEEIVKEAHIEEKFNLKINRKSDGSIEDIQNDLSNFNMKNKSKLRKKSNVKSRTKENVKGEKTVKLNRKQRLKLKNAKKKSDSIQDALEYKLDHVKFGEVVHAPPHLKTRPKGSKTKSFDKPGNRNLLLNGLINSTHF